jgi:hypothetical protein
LTPGLEIDRPTPAATPRQLDVAPAHGTRVDKIPRLRATEHQHGLFNLASQGDPVTH